MPRPLFLDGLEALASVVACSLNLLHPCIRLFLVATRDVRALFVLMLVACECMGRVLKWAEVNMVWEVLLMQLCLGLAWIAHFHRAFRPATRQPDARV